jgi:hypothetical protein
MSAWGGKSATGGIGFDEIYETNWNSDSGR